MEVSLPPILAIPSSPLSISNYFKHHLLTALPSHRKAQNERCLGCEEQRLPLLNKAEVEQCRY